LTKVGLAIFWAIFFTNSSGHPGFETREKWNSLQSANLILETSPLHIPLLFLKDSSNPVLGKIANEGQTVWGQFFNNMSCPLGVAFTPLFTPQGWTLTTV
jgi:hypothetical protein